MCRAYRIRVTALAERARRARSSFLPPEEPPARERALEYLRDGVAPAIWLYQEASTEGSDDRLSADVSQRLDRALNDWLELYAACYGVHLDADTSVPEAARLFEADRSLSETANLLTGVPGTTDGPQQGRSDVLVGPHTGPD